MRVAHLITDPADGLDAVLGPAAVMAARGHEVEILVEDPAPGAPPSEMRDGVTLRRFTAIPGRRSVAIQQMREHLRTVPGGYDVVHAHALHVLPAVEPVSAERLVLSPHLADVSASRLALVVRLLQPHRPFDALGRSGHIVCSCIGEADVLRRGLGVRPARVTVVPTPVDVDAVRAAEPFDADGEVVLVAGRLERRTRVDRVIAALAGLPDRFELVVAGTGPARRGLLALADDLGVAERVRFVAGGRDRTRRWLRTASVVAAAGEHETDVAPLLEALAAGAPVVASATRAHTELVPHGGTGAVRFAPARCSPLALADLLAEQAARAPIAVHPASLPDDEDVAERLLAVYDDLQRTPSRVPAEPARRGLGRARRDVEHA